MHIAYTEEQEALRLELRTLMNRLMTPELRAELHETEGGGPLYRETMRELGRRRWLGVGWPEAEGGRGMSPIEEFIFFDEMHRSGFPIPLLTLNTVGPTLIKFGTEAQKTAYLPGILRGELHFSIGYTEPDSGTDLASLSTTATRDGDDLIIQGQKIWTSLADHADYLWLACRTDPEAKRHKGISIVIVPMDAEGVSTTPIANLGDNNVHATYLEQVRVPASNIVGGENNGWKLITTQLNHERVALMMVGPLRRLADEVRAFAADTTAPDGRRLLEVPWVRRRLAEVEVGLEVLTLMNWRQAWQMGEGRLPMEDASAIKVYGSELYVSAHRALLEVTGAAGLLKTGSPGALLRGDLERHYRATLVLTFGGGTNEIQRDIIAAAGLRMPRTQR